jgi:phosphoglycolate phosphatase
MTPFRNRDRLVVFDVDGTLVDAFRAVDLAFSRQGMDLGNLERFQKRRKLFKYLGGLKEFPHNLRQQFGKQSRKKLLATLTEVYREEARLFPGLAALLQQLQAQAGIRVGLITRNITHEPEVTLARLFARHDIPMDDFDFVCCLPLHGDKGSEMREAGRLFGINPARALACGDEHRDYVGALSAGFHPLIVSYGFENRERLTESFAIPEAVISDSPAELAHRLRHTLDLEGGSE